MTVQQLLENLPTPYYKAAQKTEATLLPKGFSLLYERLTVGAVLDDGSSTTGWSGTATISSVAGGVSGNMLRFVATAGQTAEKTFGSVSWAASKYFSFHAKASLADKHVEVHAFNGSDYVLIGTFLTRTTFDRQLMLLPSGLTTVTKFRFKMIEAMTLDVDTIDRMDALTLTNGLVGTEEVLIKCEAWQGIEVILTPAIDKVEWRDWSRTKKRTANLDSMTTWTVSRASKSAVILTLNNGVVIEAFATGICRFKGLAQLLTFTDSQTEITKDVSEESIHVELMADDWWLAADGPWEIHEDGVNHTGHLHVEEASTIVAIFYSSIGKEKWLAHIFDYEIDDLLMGNSRFEKVARLIQLAYWARIEKDLEHANEQMALETMSLHNMAKHAGPSVAILPKPTETREAYLIRVKGEWSNRIAQCQYDRLLEVTALLIKGEVVDVTLTENANEEPALLTVTFDQDKLVANGIPVADVPQTIDDIGRILNRLAGGGIKVTISTTGGATWDSGVFDSGGWGS